MSTLRARDIANDLHAVLVGADAVVGVPAPLHLAGLGNLTFVGDVAKYAEAFEQAMTAGAIILAPIGSEPTGAAVGSLILVDNPRATFGQLVAQHFAPKVEAGVAETARVHPKAIVHPSAHIGEYTVIREGAVIAAHAEIRDHVVIGRNVVIGESSLVKSHAVIGEEGFGIEKDAAGNNFHVPHIGSAILGAHTEVGNFTTVCSGTITPTVVGDYTKIDDHVHIAHNCQIGRNVIITACAEVSGSVTIEDEVWLGPNSSIMQGVTLGRDSLLGLGAVALKSIPANEVRVGNPARRLGDNKK
ncbi:LpxD N-terminal domain-containing protein [Leucobacter sp. UT-8R-CII-1-4]|uniref:DapH/DapD/GlmU-related protein n=1 Tax=Leucobacter sp. UT-8R-CII-1-4 TaxID=3040075 RepID=UPI0024A9487E|nr:DapH/DapD/GlmU-related protein [Leucobacter sp. UT-8R-CII-1-4]MDI6023761.1 LpxD N-terminal domain-containing protein [Leucobacter sp. UT-8R-CII-1-4]